MALSRAQVCLIGLGRLGSREMTAGSDLDLILLYDAPADAESDGAKPLAASMYFMRLTQRLTSALSAPMAEGVLYEVDFRLRPSGNKGPLATSFSGFSKYQRNEAWTWEHQALCRARTVAGDAGLRERTEPNCRTSCNCRAIRGSSRMTSFQCAGAFSRRNRPPRSGISSSLKAGLQTLISLRNFWSCRDYQMVI
jgi:glutamine synthetase adenylyltransferase